MNESDQQPNPAEREPLEQQLKKARSDSNLISLTFEQRQMAERWLFEENLSYEETAERVKKEFGVETSRWSVGRFYRQRAGLRRSLEVVEAQVACDALSTMPASTEDLRTATVKLVAKSAVKLAMEKPEELKGLLPLARVLLESEQNEIRLRRVKLEERYYDFHANARCAKDLEKVRAYLNAVGDNEHLNAKEKHERVIELLFGRDKVSVKEAEEAESEEKDAAGDSGPSAQKEGPDE